MKEQWIIFSVMMSTLHSVNVQYMPFPPPLPPGQLQPPAPPPYPAPPFPPFPFPPPVQMMYPAFALKIPDPNDQTTTTTTTTESNIAIAIPMPLPMPVQVAIPAGFPPGPCQARNRPPGCPPCPPCVCSPACTPAFFSYCSPCHQKCRCRTPDEYPIPIPPQPPVPIPGPAYPVPMFPGGPPPVVVYPFPPPMPPRPRPSKSDDSCDSSSDDSSYSSHSKETRHNKKKIMLRKIARRRWNRNMFEDDLNPKPVLSYVSQDGKVHMNRRISQDDAINLLNSRKEHQTVEVSAGEDSDKKQRLIVATRSEPTMRDGHGKRPIRTAERELVGDGRKQLVFRPPDNKRISNLSVIFEVS